MLSTIRRPGRETVPCGGSITHAVSGNLLSLCDLFHPDYNPYYDAK